MPKSCQCGFEYKNYVEIQYATGLVVEGHKSKVNLLYQSFFLSE